MLSFWSFVAIFEKIPFNLILYTFFNVFHVYIAPGQGQTMLWGQNFDPNRKALSLWPFVANLKKKSLSTLILYIFLNYFIHVYSPGARADKPLGHNFDVNRKALSFWPFVVLKKSLWSLILCIFFNVFMHVYIYSPWPGADNPLVTKFWHQQKAQITLTICCKFQNDLFEF